MWLVILISSKFMPTSVCLAGHKSEERGLRLTAAEDITQTSFGLDVGEYGLGHTSWLMLMAALGIPPAVSGY